MIIGFSCGVFHQLQNNSNERFSEGLMQRFHNANANAVELMCHTVEHFTYLSNGSHTHIDQFEHISMHAPAIAYDDDVMSHEILQKMEMLCKKFSIKYIVFHPDAVKNWNVIAQYQKIPVAIENMDERKRSFRNVDDIKNILGKYSFGLVIDLQHCFANDQTMQLSRDLHGAFLERIVGYHISGYDAKLLHIPLFQTKQDMIIRELKCADVPIIIESSFKGYGDEVEEKQYIMDRL